jgi:hypothetical protein
MNESPQTQKKAAILRAIALAATVASLVLMLGGAIVPASAPTKEVPYSELVKAVEEGRGAKAVLEPDEVVLELRGDSKKLLARETIERAELEAIVATHPRRPPIRAASA